MELKKNKKLDLESKRPLFFGIGLVISLSIVITAFEWKTEIDPIVFFDEEVSVFRDNERVVITEFKKPEPPKPKVEKKPVKSVDATDKPEIEAEEIEIDFEQEIEDEDFDTYRGESDSEKADEVFLRVEKMPEFPGGERALLQFLATNIKYPKVANRVGAEGYVTVQFVIGKDGKVTDATVLKGIGFGCDEEAIRVINLLEFSPGKQRGVPVKVQMIVPINFKLQ